jgi:hypothetical protein
MDKAPFGLDIGYFQGDDFPQSQATGIHGGEDGVVIESLLSMFDRLENVSDL